MVGCVFAMNREYFFHMGAFDEGMKIWGAENVELPLRVRFALEYIPPKETFNRKFTLNSGLKFVI